ncbi:adenosylcobinamide-GDP ribazoletransferase [Pseudonocardia endophytica]|uniref:Adenosylcobinamide-GDP ribazoletransferase n=1 Tax=Pseudonocardia endophytica TaxID=401976 RepID=A0A4R1HL89_PSEEN|nr:adenosylcobinamide-GDP ribazoletransferase [Pseudonocardia endophytica]TCK21861.1 cobalamin-5'-phosphate synthase [Pseudonocardia endophytica]
MSRVVGGAALAVSWLTVVPARVRTEPDGSLPDGAAPWALRWAPVVGLVLGAAGGGLLLGLVALGVAPFVAGLLVVGAGALGTRGMHLDGLADTADGLGTYGPSERALSVMSDGGAGPFAVVTVVVVLGARAGALAQLAGAETPSVLAACAVAAATGRAGFCWVARRGVPPARPGGLGATVAGSQPSWIAPLWWVVLAAASVPLLGYAPAVGIALAGVLVVGLAAHTRRRLGGMSGDVLGAACEIATTTVLVTLSAALG